MINFTGNYEEKGLKGIQCIYMCYSLYSLSTEYNVMCDFTVNQTYGCNTCDLMNCVPPLTFVDDWVLK